MLFETRCAGCDRVAGPLCRTCRFALLGPAPRIDAAACPDVIAAVAFSGRARSILVGLKYRSRRAVARHVAGLVVNRLLEQGAHFELDVVTWAPTTSARRRQRGFDQSELVARTVARQLGVPCRSLLRRTTAESQTGRTMAERIEGAPEFIARPGMEGRSVLIIDDVVTTGATLAGARTALHDVGVTDVRLAAVAATPAPASAVVTTGPTRVVAAVSTIRHQRLSDATPRRLSSAA